MEDVNSPLFHQTKNTVLAGGGFQDNKSFVFCALSQNTQLHGGNPCRRAQWTKELVGLPKGIGQGRKPVQTY